MSNLQRYTITMSQELFAAFDQRNRRKGYSNRSEAIRDLVRDELVREDLSQPKRPTVATLTIVYDHHTRGLSEKLNIVQHDHGHEVISTLHVHLDHHNCLEVIVLRGKKAQIQALGDRISGFKGVKHSTLALTTDGKELR